MTCDRTRHNKVSEDRRQLYASRQAWKIRRLQLAGMDSHAPGRLYDWQSTVMQAADFFTTGIPCFCLLASRSPSLHTPSATATATMPTSRFSLSSFGFLIRSRQTKRIVCSIRFSSSRRRNQFQLDALVS